MIRAKRVKMAIWLVGMVALAVGFSHSAAQAANAPLPRIPKMVSELYLPEEQQASGALYNLYKGLSPAQLATLDRGGRLVVEAAKLSPQFRATLADWFNSARWGCEPPAEQVTAETMRQAAAVFVSKDQVVDFSLQSPQKKIWKRLTVACSPEKAEWVRDGLPLLPSWFLEVWNGGVRPPETREGSVLQAWNELRAGYSVYAQLSPPRLRMIHQGRRVRIHFSELPRKYQQSLADAFDERIRISNQAWGNPLDYGRPVELHRRLFGITEVSFIFARSHPQNTVAWPQGVSGLQSFPRPHRVVFVEFNPLGVDTGGRRPAVFINPPLSKMKHYTTVYLVAMPPEVQQKVLAWRRRQREWRAGWQYQEGGQTYTRPDAPPYPSDPWGATTPVSPAGDNGMRSGG